MRFPAPLGELAEVLEVAHDMGMERAAWSALPQPSIVVYDGMHAVVLTGWIQDAMQPRAWTGDPGLMQRAWPLQDLGSPRTLRWLLSSSRAMASYGDNDREGRRLRAAFMWAARRDVDRAIAAVDAWEEP